MNKLFRLNALDRLFSVLSRLEAISKVFSPPRPAFLRAFDVSFKIRDAFESFLAKPSLAERGF